MQRLPCNGICCTFGKDVEREVGQTFDKRKGRYADQILMRLEDFVARHCFQAPKNYTLSTPGLAKPFSCRAGVAYLYLDVRISEKANTRNESFRGCLYRKVSLVGGQGAVVVDSPSTIDVEAKMVRTSIWVWLGPLPGCSIVSVGLLVWVVARGDEDSCFNTMVSTANLAFQNSGEFELGTTHCVSGGVRQKIIV